MECFLVDGATRSFADVILQQRGCGKKCLVASYGFGVLQVRKVLSAFDFLLLVADISHATLNAEAYSVVVEMSEKLENFSFVATKTHAKFALVDDETLIFTSANLSANRRIESYMIGSVEEVAGVEALQRVFSLASGVVDYKKFTEDGVGQVKYSQVRAKYIDMGGLREPRYSHTVGN